MVEFIVDKMMEKLEEMELFDTGEMDPGEFRKIAREIVYAVLDFETEEADEYREDEKGEDHWFDDLGPEDDYLDE